ncbi:MAG: carbohydrate ABC transporter permease [Roseiflexaceae bacterium]
MATISTSASKIAARPARRSGLLRPGRLLTYLVLVGLALLYLYPFFWIIAGSLKSRGEFFASGLSLLPQQPVWQNYADAWTKARFALYFTNSLTVSVSVVVLVNLFTSMAGYALARTEFPGKRLLLGAVLTTLFLPAGYTIIPTFDLVRALHLNNTLWAVVVVLTSAYMIFNTFLYMGYFNTLPRELEEAARIDGAGVLRVFWSVMLPLARPMTATVTLLTFIWSWNEFFLPLVFTLSRPNLRTLAIGMYAFVGENTRDWTAMCAATIITILPIVVVFLLLQRFFVEGIAGAVK